MSKNINVGKWNSYFKEQKQQALKVLELAKKQEQEKLEKNSLILNK